MIRKVVRFEAEDGKLFEDKFDAIDYEFDRDLRMIIDTSPGSSPGFIIKHNYEELFQAIKKYKSIRRKLK